MNPEQAKYQALWGEHEQYRGVAPGEVFADAFIRIAKPTPASTIADFGCGTGRGALRIRQRTGASVRMFDFTDNCLDPEVKTWLGENFTFKQHDLTAKIDEKFDIGYCTDVLEHIAPNDVERVLLNIGLAARRLYLCINTDEDYWGGKLIGHPLHLTVKDAIWWHTLLEEMGFRIDQSREEGPTVRFWCSMYANGEDFANNADLNVDDERIKDNIRKNLLLGLQEIRPFEAQDVTVCLLAGGPSLMDHEEEIIERGRDGELFITVNGTYQWLIDRGIKPAMMFMVDARESNDKFLTTIIDTCKYFFSSQAAHEAVKKVPKDQCWLYHSTDNETIREVFEEVYGKTQKKKEWYPVPGGSTVVSRALPALAILGFRNIEIFGWDSCLREEKHHAYEQKENDAEVVVDMMVGGKTFKCHPWMVAQAQEVPLLVRHILADVPGFNLCVRGDGLIAHILNHAASLAEKEE